MELSAIIAFGATAIIIAIFFDPSVRNRLRTMRQHRQRFIDNLEGENPVEPMEPVKQLPEKKKTKRRASRIALSA